MCEYKRTILLSLNPRKKINILKIKVLIKIKTEDCELFIKQKKDLWQEKIDKKIDKKVDDDDDDVEDNDNDEEEEKKDFEVVKLWFWSCEVVK